MKVFVKQGRWRGSLITNVTFQLDHPEIKWHKEGARNEAKIKPCVIIKTDETNRSFFGFTSDKTCKIFFDDTDDIEVYDGNTVVNLQHKSRQEYVPSKIAKKPVSQVIVTSSNEETDETIKTRIAERFEILHELSTQVSKANMKGLVVYGAPGVGKSYGVERALWRDSLGEKLAFDPNDQTQIRRISRAPDGSCTFKPRFRIIKGHVSPVGLYKLLYEYSEKGETLVFDDCDSVLMDEISLNLLKTALDSSEKRVLNWIISDQRVEHSVPKSYEYNGAVIFITNINFEKTVKENKSKLAPHLDAIMSRCLYLDLTIDTMREKLLRIEQVCKDSGMLNKSNLSSSQIEEILDFVEENAYIMRELSLRKVLQIADIRKTGDNWRRIAQITCLKNVR